MTSFGLSESVVSDNPFAMRYGNFDADPEPEIVTGGIGVLNTDVFSIYDFDSEGYFNQVYTSIAAPLMPRRGLEVAYINSDNLLDVVHVDNSVRHEIEVYDGEGQKNFSEPVTSLLEAPKSYVASLGNYNSDEFLDYVIGGWHYVSIFYGSASSEFSLASQIDVTDSIISIISFDFNNDGFDDLAIGIRAGLKIYLGDGAGNLSLKSTYSQFFGSVDI